MSHPSSPNACPAGWKACQRAPCLVDSTITGVTSNLEWTQTRAMDSQCCLLPCTGIARARALAKESLECGVHAACLMAAWPPCAGIIGGNGSGKSTLFRMIMGQEQPDSGELVIGETVQLMYSEQSREGLDGERTVRRPPTLRKPCMVLQRPGK